MGVIHDSIDPTEHVQVGLSAPQEPDFPYTLNCPEGHESTLHKHLGRIPYYVCESCQVVYRVQEMR